MCAHSKVARRLLELLRDESGPTAVEYAVLLGLIIMAAIGAVTAYGTSLRSSWETIVSSLSLGP